MRKLTIHSDEGLSGQIKAHYLDFFY